MRPIWKPSDSLATKNGTLIIKEFLQEFHINGHGQIWITLLPLFVRVSDESTINAFIICKGE